MNPGANSSSSSAFPWPNIRIVLVEPSHPGNIGGAARAMKNMGLESLCLVNPQSFPDPEATARASGADDVLANARVCDSLEAAIADCSLAVATSARRRTIAWPELDAPACARELVAHGRLAPVALVFGREQSGLNNAELDLCHAMVRLPANPAFSSLNLACAVQVLAYELRLAVLQDTAAGEMSTAGPPASNVELQRLFAHLRDTLLAVGFMPEHRAPSLMRKLMRFFYRSRITQEEVNIFRGIVTELDILQNKLADQDDQPPPAV